MAGLYADVPGHRFAYDVDGSSCLMSSNGAPYAAIDAALINDEANDAQVLFNYREQGDRIIAIGFPEARDLAGFFVWGWTANNNIATFQYMTSTDTTDGSNGTWTAAANFTPQTAVYPQSRNAITTAAATGIRGIRFRFATSGDYQQYSLGAIHLYGLTAPSSSPERLEFWHPTLDQQADKATFDFGDIAQGQIATKQFRIKNLSTTKTAGTVAISANNAAGGETLLANGLTFSSDGTSFAATLNIASIAASGVTPVLYARRTVGATDPASIRFARVTASPGTFA